MAEVKNNFLKSKMNQDLDDRLIPNGEYRYANNISVGKTQSDDIGALENILGNDTLQFTSSLPNEEGLECIGAFMDNQNNRIFQFLTDYVDPSPELITPPIEGIMRITVYDLGNPESYTTLVEGKFLNFAKNKEFRITGINLIEDLLFWTDNRNQPRKINVSNALNNINYYTKEEQISVAKYAPVDAITLYKKTTAIVTDIISTTEIELDDASNIVTGMTVISNNFDGSDYIVVTNVTGNIITLYEAPGTPISIDDSLTFLISTMSDKSSVSTWPGDPAFLEDKYVRFSYRFKYDDNEYSLMAPFTQIAYIPKQKGYFIAGNETDAYRSTVVNWFENNINNIELIIPLPDKINNLTNNYKIKEIDILYKESDSLNVKVFETLQVSVINTVNNANNNYYIQPYQSQKPYKTLPDDQITRVYDKIPVRARAQESAGNRIIYGNYYDKYTCPTSINYNVSIQPKLPNGTNFIEYPNHTLKKNRNYQVGFVLADKFGRQSPVILSSVDLIGTNLGGGQYAKGSTIYSSYNNSVLFDNVKTWFGDTLILHLNSTIDQQKYLPAGKSGLYAIPTSTFGFAITDLLESTPTEYVFTMDLTALNSQFVPVVGNILRGKYVDYVEVLTSNIEYQIPGDPLSPIAVVTITTSGSIGDIYNYNDPGGGLPDIKFAYIYNPIGWYSYKIVVKQQEQDYYNVYLPGILNGYPKNQTYGSQVIYDNTGLASLQTGINTTQFPVSETGNTSHIVLINDNINKVPRDLSEVGPDQKQYRSSVQLYGRVENTEDIIEIIGEAPLYSAKAITITYDTGTVGQGEYFLIKPGDGIQCYEASVPIEDNTPPATPGATKPNPYIWVKDTVVVSNEVVGTVGTITLSTPNWVLEASQNPITSGPGSGDYINFTITRAENRQYFPTRKADVVNSIATASEFNFLDNSVDNLSGTAALNFYQLQSSPLIGRISTVNKIGVVGEDMIPFLGVYETRPEESLLDLFWETATTGLISDLNADVLTGFDGPSSFADFNYIHFEHQNPNGGGSDTGESDSKYITDEFAVLNQYGVILPNTQVTLASVFDGANNPRITDFGIETITGGPETLYRLYIKTPFVFNNNAPELESYEFTFNVIDLDNLTSGTTLTASGRLGNNTPIITTEEINYNITQNTTTIVILEAVNGSYLNLTTGLKWSIINGNTPAYFGIDESTGELKLINSEAPLGGYELEIKVQDAVNTTNGSILPPEGDTFGTQYATIILNITIGDEPVPYWLRPPYESITTINGGTSCGDTIMEDTTYGMVYIGPKIDLTGTYLPEIPDSNRDYQIAENIEITNVNIWGGGQPIIPSGLTQGEYRIKVKMRVPTPLFCNEEIGLAQIDSYFKIYLYRRVYTPEGLNTWQLTNTANNQSTPYELPNLVVSTLEVDEVISYGQEKIITTSFTIEADPIIFYEWAVGVKMQNNPYNTAEETYPIITIYGEDANFSYDMDGPSTWPPIVNSYTYNTNIETVTNYTSAIPYGNQDARVGVIYESLINPISSGTVNNGDVTFTFTLTNTNNQVTPGLFAEVYYGISLYALCKIVFVNPVNPKIITVQTEDPGGFPGSTPTNLTGRNVIFFGGDNGVGPVFGLLYANTIEGTEVKRFYTDTAFTQKWIPPFANKFYVFQSEKDYNPDNAMFTDGPSAGQFKYSKYPYFCARFNEEGEMIEQIIPDPDSQTAWVGMNVGNNALIPIANYSYNIYYEEPPTP